MNAARILLCLLFTACMVWLWYPYFSQNNNAQVKDEHVIATPDYTARALKQTAYDETGKINYRVTAAKMELYQQLGFTFFEHPIFTIYNEQQTWQVKAKEATLYENERLIFEGDVVAKNLTNDGMIENITAENIEVNINLKTMVSEQPVIITGPSLKITGQGLEADLKTEIIKLTNHTRTTYYDQ